MSDSSLELVDGSDPPADLDLFDDGASSAAGDGCPECGHPGISKGPGWCAACGFYPALNLHIDVEQEQQEEAEPEPQKVDPLEMLRQIPPWVPILLAGAVVLTIVSVAARMTIPVTSMSRPIWALSQFAIGFVLFVIAHFAAYLYAIVEDSSFTVLDILLRPLKVWGPTIHGLPETSKRVYMGSWGVLAAVLGLFVVDGIPYHKLWELGPEEQAKPNLVHAVTDMARAGEDSDMSMEEAIEAFAGQAGTDDLTPPPLDDYDPYEPPSRPRHIDCLIVGYEPHELDGFTALALAGVHKGALRYIGTVSNEYINPEMRAELLAQMELLVRDRPFVLAREEGFRWLAPKLTCRIGYDHWDEDDRLESSVFEKRLANIEQD